jgi:hypothetical protein
VNFRLQVQIADFRFRLQIQIADSDCRFQIADSDCRFQIARFRLQTSDCES